MNLRTLAVILAAGFWIPGHLHYGWLLVQTVTSAPNLWIRVLFTFQFTLWLFPTAGLAALLIMEQLRTNR